MNYLVSMLENNSFDNIVHEHLEYYSLISLEKLLARHNLEIFDLEINGVNGGSIRAYIKHKEARFSISSKIQEIKENERQIGLNDIKTIY